MMEFELLKRCERCDLAKGRNQVVLPRGNVESDLVFIGEAPGRNEDKEGIPFIGQAGEWFNAMIRYLELTEEDFFLTNTVKCRPTKNGKNRKPHINEIEECGYWLKQELEMVNPRVIILMGSVALKAFFRGNKISQVAGHELKGHKYFSKKGIKIFALFHPAVLIYNKKEYKPKYREHLDTLKNFLKGELII